jgi:cytochrome c peroxidase
MKSFTNDRSSKIAITRGLSLIIALVFSGLTLRATFAAGGALSASEDVSSAIEEARAALGARLFADDRFSSPNGDFRQSCSHCHMTNQDPGGVRAYTDFLPKSWVPWRSSDPRRDGLRNAPTLLDAGRMPRLHFDGEFGSLEELVKGTLSGRSLGWLPGEEKEAFAQVYKVVVRDEPEGGPAGRSYRDLFRDAYSVDLRAGTPEEVVEWAARALSDFVRDLKTERTTPYDEFMRANELDESLSATETAAAYSARTLAKLSDLETQRRLRLSARFDAKALAGLKIFLRSDQEAGSGNCVACHAPPFFSDFAFHNMGTSQLEYDLVHGDGSFAQLRIPSAASAVRPAPQFKETASVAKREQADLGYWNYVRLDGTERRPDETADALLVRMIAAFKTPTLRNLAYSQPYMHNGMYPTLESALSEIIAASELARAGRVRSADEQLARIRIGEGDIVPLIAFLSTLNQDLGKTRDADY